MKEKDPLDQLVSIILTKPKYQNIHPDFIRHIGKQELVKRTNLKEAVKATRSKLHQVGAAYFDCKPDYSARQAQMKGLSKDNENNKLKAFCQLVMQNHASSRERLPILKTFFNETLAKLTPITSVLDLACGFNPLAIPWMPLNKNSCYLAYDIYHDLIAFINYFFTYTAVKGKAVTANIITDIPHSPVQIALLLKSLPCLEQFEKGISRRLLNKINARHLLVSYPIHSLSGKSKGMRENYTRQLNELIKYKSWEVERFDFPSELAFLIHK
ncbi:MAG TPA: 16S rRNA methyltransferase [Anaerolineae bacterium]|nr:16S rRNA methyltransferase [Anaerolineae bacterium]